MPRAPCWKMSTRTPHACTWYEILRIYILVPDICEESKEIQEGSPTNNILVGNYSLRRTERWENTRRVSSEVGDIYY